MTHILKLFLPNDFYDEMMYQYKGEEGQKKLRALISSFVKPLGKQASLSILNGTTQVRIIKNGQLTMEEMSLKDLDYDNIQIGSDPDWIPERVTRDEIKIFEMSIPDRLHKDLMSFGRLFVARYTNWNKNLDKKDPAQLAQVAELPTCIEQVIQDTVITNLSNSLAQNIDADYDKGLEEIEKDIESKQPPKR